MTAARVLFWMAMVGWGALEGRHHRHLSVVDRTQDRGTFAWSLGASLGGLAAVLVLDQVLPAMVEEQDQFPFLVAGASLVAGGVAFRLWAIRTLGRFFTYQVSTQADQRVVTDGPYRWLCHPSYTGLLVSCAGAGIATANAASIAAAIAIPIYGLTRRIRVEEAAMLEGLGVEYARFRGSRKRLLPGIW